MVRLRPATLNRVLVPEHEVLLFRQNYPKPSATAVRVSLRDAWNKLVQSEFSEKSSLRVNRIFLPIDVQDALMLRSTGMCESSLGAPDVAVSQNQW